MILIEPDHYNKFGLSAEDIKKAYIEALQRREARFVCADIMGERPLRNKTKRDIPST